MRRQAPPSEIQLLPRSLNPLYRRRRDRRPRSPAAHAVAAFEGLPEGGGEEIADARNFAGHCGCFRRTLLLRRACFAALASPRLLRRACFAALASPGQVVHLPIKTGGGRKSTRRPEFFWVNTVLANVKNNVLGMHRAVRPKHVPRYLAQFQWRFNRPMGLTVSIWIAQADQTASDLDRCSDIAPPRSDGSV
jgi:hypothetical protein